MGLTQLKMDYLNKLPHMTFVEDPAVKGNFIMMHMNVKGASESEADMFYNKESMYMKRLIYESANTSGDLRKATVFSLYACFMDIAVNGLSLERAANLVYIEQRGYKTGRQENGQDVYENRAKLIISPYGELALRMEMGQIKYADTPVIVYDGEPFKVKTTENGNKVVIWESVYPRKSKKIVASFVKITRPNDSFDYSYMMQEEIDRLAAASARQNRGKTNALYGAGENGAGIDAGFLAAKTLKHAFKAFPKVKIKGTNSEMDGEDAEEMPEWMKSMPVVNATQHHPEPEHTSGLGPITDVDQAKADFVAEVPVKKGIVIVDEDESF